MAEWISVEDELPETGKRVLWCGPKNGMVIARFSGCCYKGRASAITGGKVYNATHWMPLPEPPEGGADG